MVIIIHICLLFIVMKGYKYFLQESNIFKKHIFGNSYFCILVTKTIVLFQVFIMKRIQVTRMDNKRSSTLLLYAFPWQLLHVFKYTVVTFCILQFIELGQKPL